MRPVEDAPHRTAPRGPGPRGEDGLETIEMAFVAALFMVIIVAAFPLLSAGIDGAFDLISARFAAIEIGD